MTRSQLEHAIRAACDVSGDTEVWVFGSQAILGEHPDAPIEVRYSMEADLAPKNHPDRVVAIDGVLGELSMFHSTPIETAVLPYGWNRRTIKLQNANTRDYVGWCVESHDLAASKLVAFRDKDRGFVRVLLETRLIRGSVLLERVEMLDVIPELRDRIRRWVRATLVDL